MDSRSLCAIILAVSAVLILQASIDCDKTNCRGNIPIAIGIGVVSLLLAVAALYEQRFLRVATAIVFVLWCVAAAWLTFDSPYLFIGNAYIAIWIGFFASAALVGTVYGEHIGTHSTTGALLLASIMELAQASLDCRNGCRTDNHSIAVAVGAVSCFFCLVILLLNYRGGVPHLNLMSIFLFCWWIFGWTYLTMDGPYILGGNGFFSCWAGLLFSAALFAQYGGLFGRSGGGTATTTTTTKTTSAANYSQNAKTHCSTCRKPLQAGTKFCTD